MKIACTYSDQQGDTDQLLRVVADRLLDQRVRVRGTVQFNTEGQERRGPCDMDVKVLPDGPLLRISQNLGSGSQGCRLDAGALETAVERVSRSIKGGADCLLINKFGKQEADGHGFRDVIAGALGLGIPVLVGLNRRNQDGFAEFSGGLAETLPPNVEAIEKWILAHVERQQMAV